MPLPCPPEALTVEAVRFESGPYLLEGELAYPDVEPPVGAALIVGPHPLLGGHMGNNVVRGLGDGLARHGLATLRFNYRGVGGSEGPVPDVAQLAQFWEASRLPDEASHRDDFTAALESLRAAVGGELPMALVGYSYGCSLLPFATTAGQSRSPLVLVAPTVGTHDYDCFAAVTAPRLVIAPEGDFAADAARLLRWYVGLPEPKRLARPRLDSHFFRGHEDWLTETVAAFIYEEWS
jgi:alpha/beta superfamily hydrolase